MSAASLGVEAQIERQMMEFGSGIITDLDRFMMPDINNCDMDGHEVYVNELGEITRYQSFGSTW